MKSTTIVVISDLHCGSTVGLSPLNFSLDDGGTYAANAFQLWLSKQWNTFWDGVPKRNLWVVINGDIVDGNHHGTRQIVSPNEIDHINMAEELLAPIRKRSARLFVVRGTEAHVGPGAAYDEEVARRLCAEKSREGTHSWWLLTLQCRQTIIEFAHHGSVSRIARNRGSSVSALAADTIMRYYNETYRPHVVVRSHAHVFADSGETHPVRALHTPAWQLSTAYGHRVAAGVLPDIGGVVFDVTDEAYSARIYRYHMPRAAPWTHPHPA